MSNDIYADKIIPVSSNQVSINSSVNVTGNITCVSPDTGLSSSVLLSNDFAKYIGNTLSGLTISNSSGDLEHDITTAIGYCPDSTGTYILKLTSPLTKRIDAPWSSGNNSGGLFSGSVASTTWYYKFLIRKDSDGTVDSGFDTSITAANKPSGYTYYRRIGAVLTNGSQNIVKFRQQNKNEFIWDILVQNCATNHPGMSAVLQAVTYNQKVTLRSQLAS